MKNSNIKKKVNIETFPLETLEDIEKFTALTMKTADKHIDEVPKTELETKQMGMDIPTYMNTHSKVVLRANDKIIDLEDEYDEIFESLWKQWKRGVVHGEKLDRFYDDREIKILIPKDKSLRDINKKIKKLKNLEKFEISVFKQLTTKSFALNRYESSDEMYSQLS